MKKNVKTIMGGFLSVALLAGFISCSNGTSDETNQAAQGLNLAGASSASGTAIAAEDIFSGEKITFKVTDASTTAEDTVFVIKYDRSAKGAAEKITLNDVNVEVTVNGEAVSIGNKIDFELDPYSSFNPSYNYSSPESANDQHEYKAKPVINKKLGKDDIVTIEVKSAKVSGEGAGKVDLGKITVAVVDVNKAVNYYKEVAVSGEKAEKYIPLISKKNGKGLNEVETSAPANNTPENPAPANPTPENPTPANNTSTPAATTPTPVTVTNCKVYTMTVTRDATKEETALVFQIDNDGSKDANGLKLDVTDLELSVKVGDAEPFTASTTTVKMIPNEWASPSFAKTDNRFVLGIPNDITAGTKIEIQVKKATISDSTKAGAVIYALQSDTKYDMLVENSDNYKAIFATE